MKNKCIKAHPTSPNHRRCMSKGCQVLHTQWAMPPPERAKLVGAQLLIQICRRDHSRPPCRCLGMHCVALPLYGTVSARAHVCSCELLVGLPAFKPPFLLLGF